MCKAQLTKCENKDCPYNGTPYHLPEHRDSSKHGAMCLNCIDDFEKDSEVLEEITMRCIHCRELPEHCQCQGY